MINIPIKISIPEIWEGTFEKNAWCPVNFIVGANGTGKSLFSEKLKEQLNRNQIKTRLLTAERLAGFEKRDYSYFTSGGITRGLDISYFNSYKDYGEQYGLSTSAFVILKERLDIRIKIEALLSDLFKKVIRLVEEGGYLKPKIQNIDGGTEYVLKEKECHGLKEIITLLTFLYDDKYNCIIFDEPELHLHPQFQSFFLNEIRKLAGDPTTDSNKKLIYIITHSPYFLDFRSIEDLQSIMVCSTKQMPTYIKSEDLDSQDIYVLNRFLPRFNTHHKQFFFSPNPVFVEGYTDQQIITLIFEKVGMNIAASGSSIIDVGGKDELAVFYKLCRKLGIACRIIVDYDAFFRGKLREFFSKDERAIDCFIKEAMGEDIASCIGDIERKLLNIADTINQVPSINSVELQSLKNHLTELYKDRTSNIEKIKDVILLSIYRIGNEIMSVLPNPRELDALKHKHLKCIECIEAAHIYLIPNGELEHFFKASSIDYLNITNKDKLFHAERDYIIGLDNGKIKENYSDLLPLLSKAIPHVNVDILKHLRFIIVEWIQNIQNAIIRDEIKDVASFKTNARVNYALYNQIFEISDNGLSINADKTFSCSIKIKQPMLGAEKEIKFDHNTTPQNFIFSI